MKKYGIIAIATFLVVSCNSNKDKEATPTNGTETTTNENGNQATNEASGLLSGKYEIVDYKKNNATVVLPNKITVEFTKDGNVIKSDGNNFLYKIEADSISFLTSPNVIIRKSKIEFLNSDKTSFVIKTPLDNSETTYQKIK